VIHALNIPHSVVGEFMYEYRLADQNDQPGRDMTAAERADVYSDFMIEGRRYLLPNLFGPVGTTPNGFVTLSRPV